MDEQKLFELNPLRNKKCLNLNNGVTAHSADHLMKSVERGLEQSVFLLCSSHKVSESEQTSFIVLSMALTINFFKGVFSCVTAVA